MECSKKEKKIETILLNNNNISNADVFKKKIFPLIKDINLDENKLLEKDIKEIKDIIKGILKPEIKYKLKKVSSQVNIRYNQTINNNWNNNNKENNNSYIPFGPLPLIQSQPNLLTKSKQIQRNSSVPKYPPHQK